MEQVVMSGGGGWRDMATRHRADDPTEQPGPRRVGSWLRRELGYRGLTQEDFAEQIGVNRTNISRWWKGEVAPSIPTLEKFADTLGVELDFLLEIAGYRPPDVELGDDVEALVSMLRGLRFDYDPGRHAMLRSILQTYKQQDRQRAIEERN